VTSESHIPFFHVFLSTTDHLSWQLQNFLQDLHEWGHGQPVDHIM